jgi:c-di-GMP-binding flagellar brake protein YcgR
MNNERRQIPRLEVKKEVKVFMQQMQALSDCIIEDMHLKGMSVSFNERLPHQQAMEMSFAIGEKSGFIKTEVRIPWEKEEQGRYVYGLAFSKIADMDKEKVYQFINTHCNDQLRKNWWGECSKAALVK